MLQPSQMQGEGRNCEKRRFGALCARLCMLRVQDQLENWTNYPLLIATHSDFDASTLKNAREARNWEKRRFGKPRAQLCALRAQDQLENLTNCPLLIATRSDFYASTLKNTRGSQKSRKRHFGALRARLCALHAQDQLEYLTNCSLLLATHSDF